MRRVYRGSYTALVITTAPENSGLVRTGGLYRAADVRALDAALIADGIAGYELMSRAAAAALQMLRARWSVSRDLLVLCGSGNNGGDGFVLARLAHEAGLAPRVIGIVPSSELKGDAARAAADCAASGVPILLRENVDLVRELECCDLIVDALLGIGLTENVREPIAALISATNAARRPIVSLDVPSGLCADSGRERGVAMRADLTVTFIARKAGLYLGAGPDHCGEIVLATLADASNVAGAAGVTPRLRLIDTASLALRLPTRSRDTHKGQAGHVLVVGGGPGMPGAARLAGEGALRAGAGRVTVCSAPESAAAIVAGRAELMVRGIDDASALVPLLGTVDAVALGPGLGQSAWAHAIFDTVLQASRARALPLVIDADALNLLAMSEPTQAGRAETGKVALPAHCVLTPHPGEAARLLGRDAAFVQADRPAALAQLQSRYAQATVVLKGAGTLVSAAVPGLCVAGHPAMAAPGMGDVLTGMIAALLAQSMGAQDAANAAVLWHALAGERAARADRGLLASELVQHLPSVRGEWHR